MFDVGCSLFEVSPVPRPTPLAPYPDVPSLKFPPSKVSPPPLRRPAAVRRVPLARIAASHSYIVTLQPKTALLARPRLKTPTAQINFGFHATSRALIFHPRHGGAVGVRLLESCAFHPNLKR